jgi:tetratricopeptide (TPR) repeat protein
MKLAKYANWKGAAAIGAVVGLTVSAIKNPDFNWDRMTEKWKPKKYKKINEINEYFDRLEYIKYKGLYADASRKAALFENAPIKMIFKEMDKNKKRIQKLKKKQENLLDKFNENDSRYKAKNAEIQREIEALQQRGNQMFTGGKYTKAAVAYKKAMESTIYGLSEGATQDEILAAVPDQYKDYFQAFMEEKDDKARKEILSHLPDYLKRPLQAAWGQKLDNVQSNRKYFRSHHLPKVGWRGWKPNVNLKHVKMKTIENEGMLLSDFGYYESEKAKPVYQMAPDLKKKWNNGSGFGMSVNSRLAAELRGMGVITSNVSIEHTSTPGFWITSDIKQSITDRYELTTNTMTNMIQGLVSNFI